MSDISTRYLGLARKAPLVASASPLCESVPNIRELEDAGVGAVVLASAIVNIVFSALSAAPAAG